MRLNRLLSKVLIAAGLLSSATGFTDCKHYSLVTIPSSEAKAPSIYNGVYDASNDAWLVLRGNGESVDVTITNPSQRVLGIGAAMDSSGVKRVETTYSGRVRCCGFNGTDVICGITSGDNFSRKEVATQTGTAGEKVFNGSFTALDLTPEAFLAKKCGHYHPADGFWLTFETKAFDFNGNVSAVVKGHSVSFSGPG